MQTQLAGRIARSPQPPRLHQALRTRPLLLIALACVSCCVAGIPLLYLVVRALQLEPTLWGQLWTSSIPGLLGATVVLTGTTVLVTALLGIGAAWLVERSDLPGRRFFRPLLALPLAIPAYVAAICWLTLLRRGGLIEQALIALTGMPRGQVPLPDLYGLGGATLVIALCVYPYVYMPAAAALRSLDCSIDEAARMAGHSALTRFLRVTLPLLLPAIGTGVVLVSLYVISDFGTVALLRYRTFTTAIYNQLTGQLDRSAAAGLSAVLIMLSMPLLLIETHLSHRKGRITRDKCWRPYRMTALGHWRWPAFISLCILVSLALGLPLLVLSGLALQGWLLPTRVDTIWMLNNDGVMRYGLNSLVVATLAAACALLLALAPGYLVVRYRSRLARVIQTLTKSAFALPGTIVGLALVLILNRWVPFIYGTIAALVLGLAVRVMPQAAATTESALRTVAPTLEHAGRTLGSHTWGVLRRITIPIAAPGFAAAWSLCFITAMKELPVALLLRPAGADTLPIRIWSAASESVYTQAAPPALLLIGLSFLGLLIASGGWNGLNRMLSTHSDT